jgi:hypothetical protein
MAAYELRIIPDIHSGDTITEVIETDTPPEISVEGRCLMLRYDATVRAFVTDRFYSLALSEFNPLTDV